MTKTKVKEKSISIQDPISHSEEIRATFLVNVHMLERIKAIAYWKRKPIKKIVQEALESYFDNQEEIELALELYRNNIEKI